jgi:hypothetical protein
LLLKEYSFIYLPYIKALVKMGLKSDITETLRKYYFIVAYIRRLSK